MRSHAVLAISDHQIKVFDLRLLFLFTALCPEQRDLARWRIFQKEIYLLISINLKEKYQ